MVGEERKVFPWKEQDIVPRKRRTHRSPYGDIHSTESESPREEKAVQRGLRARAEIQKQRNVGPSVLGPLRRLE